MRKVDGYEQAQARTGEFETLIPGGYVCKILSVKAEDKDYGTLLRIAFDIVEGEHKDFYKKQFDRKKEGNPDTKWPGMYYQTAKNGEESGYFKGFITAIENSNSGYKWDWDEQKLKGKLFGGIFAEEEYEIRQGKHAGEIGTSVKCRNIRSADKIRSGDYKVPDKKLLPASHNNDTSSSSDETKFPWDE